MFEHIEPFAGDPILSLNEDFQKDPRPGKINLSIGIYFDDEGRIPVLDCVRQAETQLLAKGGAKPYLPIEGNADFRRAVQTLLFGSGSATVAEGRERLEHYQANGPTPRAFWFSPSSRYTPPTLVSPAASPRRSPTARR